MQYVSPVVGRIGDFAIDKVGGEICYLIRYKKNMKNLEQQAENLQTKRASIQRQIEAAKRNLENIEGNVQNWVRDVDAIISDTQTLLKADQEKVNHRCFNGWCINLWARYKFSKEAFEKAGKITKFEGTQFESLSYRPPSLEMVSFSSSKMFAGLESRKTKVKEIMKALDDENINVIGICGMGGVGKTTIVEEVFRQANAEKKFDMIVMVVVSQTPNVTKIQDDVAQKLGLKLENFGNAERVSALTVRIKREKKILIILDDVWKRLELEEVGVPFGEDHKGCKILLTSRSEDVCSEMDAQKTFPIQVLSELEAWVLFREMVGAAADSSDLNSIATEVARRCGGLPIAIVTVGRALRNRSKDVWIDVVRQLKKPIPKRIKGMDAFVYSRLELSYNYLEDEEAKSLFLLCSLFPEDDEIEVETLVQYGMGLRLFQDVDTIQDGRVRARALVSTLLSYSLLLKGDYYDLVKMHDLVRDAAIVIASKEENKYMVKAGAGLRDWPNPETIFQTYTGISLMWNDIRGLPDGLECPKLETLLLQNNSRRSNLEIPPNFFQGMKDLKVLDMSFNQILSLPPSISLLATLRTLSLVHCDLGDISFIGTLKQLEILNLSGSNIQVVPGVFTQLTHLRLFDLRYCYGLMQIAPGVISSLCKLEELYFSSHFTNWAVEGEGEEEDSRTSASLAELKSLSRLTSLFLLVPNADLLPHDLNLQNLTRFSIEIGNPFPEPIFEKNLSLTFDTRLSGPEKVLVKRTEALTLSNCRGLENILEDLDNDGFNELKILRIWSCNEIKYLVDTIDPMVVFRSLEELKLFDLRTFTEICHGQLPSESFGKVRTLEMQFCHSMVNIVPSNLLSRLQCLQTVIANRCDSLQNAFDLEGLATERDGTEFLSTLEKLELRDLPELIHIWKGSLHRVNLCKLREVFLVSCIKVRRTFPPSLVQKLVRLDRLLVYGCSNLEEIFGTHNEQQIEIVVPGKSLGTNMSLRNLITVAVSECDKLRYIFPLSVARGLVLLQNIRIDYCAMVESIVEEEKGEEKVSSIEKIVFPHLHMIILSCLDNLTCFCKGRYAAEYPHLEGIVIESCPKMEIFGHGAQISPNLKKVRLQQGGAEGIWKGDLNSTVQEIFNQKAKPPE
ncbi:disease resistance protein At4g27190-like [Actinidia eriantha]|uniref:disease resistance protein At4g27190-like n=1 Tax=Actinidia eriantha TaxID=165200 RepID=UPI002583F088|nr:disease resistance protein At4g27190-like [Actinidia eriantha]